MRLILLYCIILACIATSLTEETVRPKRHLSYWKNLILSHLFGSDESTKADLTPILGPPAVLASNGENFKLYRIPGFRNILVKAVPRAQIVRDDANTTDEPSPEVNKESEPTVAILENYLGTKTMNETVDALKHIRDMLQSGVLTAQKEADQPKKEAIFVIPPMVSDLQIKPIIIRPPKIPSAPFLSHRQPVTIVQNDIILPKPVPVQPIVPLPVLPPPQYDFKQLNSDGSVTSYTSFDGQDVIVTETNQPPPPPPRFLIDRLQHLVNMPVPIRPPVPEFVSNFFVPKPVKPVAVIDVPVPQVVKSRPPIFVEKIRVNPYRPCCKSSFRPPVFIKESVVVPARPTLFIKQNIPVMPQPMLVQDTVAVPRPPSIIVDRLQKIAGGRIVPHQPIVTIPSMAMPSRESILEQSKSVNVYPSWSTTKLSETKESSGVKFYVKNSDGTLTTFSKLPGDGNEHVSSGLSDHEGFFQTDDGRIFYSRLINGNDKAQPQPLTSNYVSEFSKLDNDEGYFQTEDGKIFYSRLIKPHDYPFPLSSTYSEDEVAKKRRKNQFTVTTVEEAKNVLNQGDVLVTYGTDKDNNPYLSYKVPSGGYSFEQVKHFSKLTEEERQKVEVSTTKTTKLPSESTVTQPLKIQIGGVKESEEKSQSIDTKLNLSSGPSTYSFKQIHEDGSITEYTGHEATRKHGQLSLESQKETSATDTNSYAKGETGSVNIYRSREPTPSRYTYTQINHGNLEPLTAVPVQDAPTKFSVEKGEVHVNVNAHEHRRPDGSSYLCTEVHSIPAGVIENIPPPVGSVIPTLPKEFIFVPPADADAPFPSHKIEKHTVNGNYSFKLVNTGVTLPTESPVESNSESISLKDNPIVVSEESVQRSSSRGDIPEAFS